MKRPLSFITISFFSSDSSPPGRFTASNMLQFVDHHNIITIIS